MARSGLNTASTIRVHKLAVLGKHEIVRRIGELSSADRAALATVLDRAFSLDLERPAAHYAICHEVGFRETHEESGADVPRTPFLVDRRT